MRKGKWNTRTGRTIELNVNCSKMEKQSKFRIQILKFLSQAAAPAVTYKSPPPSPRHPIVSIIPKEARRKQRNGSSSLASREPTSPTVSCMGQVKGKNKHKKKKRSKPKAKQVCPPPSPPPPPQDSISLALYAPKEKVFKLSNVLSKVLIHQGKTKDDGSVAMSSLSRASCGPERVPSLGQMKRFDSQRGVLSDFDILEVADRLDNLKTGDDENEKNKKDGIMLWKRRNMSPPTPIQL